MTSPPTTSESVCIGTLFFWAAVNNIGEASGVNSQIIRVGLCAEYISLQPLAFHTQAQDTDKHLITSSWTQSSLNSRPEPSIFYPRFRVGVLSHRVVYTRRYRIRLHVRVDSNRLHDAPLEIAHRFFLLLHTCNDCSQMLHGRKLFA